MNYYPYINMMPYVASVPARTGFLGNLFRGINFSSILNGTGRVLNIANQAIPLIKQAKPVINNAKTMFKVMNEFRNVDNPSNNSTNINNSSNINSSNINQIDEVKATNNVSNNLPTFFQ